MIKNICTNTFRDFLLEQLDEKIELIRIVNYEYLNYKNCCTSEYKVCLPYERWEYLVINNEKINDRDLFDYIDMYGEILPIFMDS